MPRRIENACIGARTCTSDGPRFGAEVARPENPNPIKRQKCRPLNFRAIAEIFIKISTRLREF